MGLDRVVTIGSKATRPLSDFLMVADYEGPPAGRYYVDLNVSASGDGSSEYPFATLAEAIIKSNADIASSANRWWARRNRIFVCGDGIEESLTVLPEKCDIIGCGSDLAPFPRIIGHHTIAVAKVGCRFINMGFQADGTGDLFVIPAGCHGLQFLGGMMQPSTAGNTKALEITDSALVVIYGVRIVQNPAAYGTGTFGVGISIEGTASTHQILIDRNWVNATKGVTCVASSPAYDGVISRNFFHTVDMWVDDDSDQFHVIDNRAVTDIDTATSTSGYDFDLKKAVGNIQTGSGGETDWIPFGLVAEG
jgi:hypothetical protein